MQEAASSLLGEHDFAAFANELLPQEPTMRDLRVCRVRSYREFVIVRVEANAFLRGMVRNIVGTLMEVGMGKRERDSLRELLVSQDRRLAGATAPPQGLCLLQVRYGERKTYPRQQERRETEP
jgi:tRNA pseudouridine38-40 synthase